MNHKRGYPRSRRPHSCFCKGKFDKVVTHEPKPSVKRRLQDSVRQLAIAESEVD